MRMPWQMSETDKFQPPCNDVNAADLYLPIMGVWTHVILLLISRIHQKKFNTDAVYAVVRSACLCAESSCSSVQPPLSSRSPAGVWCLLRVGVLHGCAEDALPDDPCQPSLGGSSSVHRLHVHPGMRHNGCPLGWWWVLLSCRQTRTYVCMSTLCELAACAGSWAWTLIWLYSSLMMSIFQIRTMKRVVYQESRQYGKHATKLVPAFLVLNSCTGRWRQFAFELRTAGVGGNAVSLRILARDACLSRTLTNMHTGEGSETLPCY
jgi:protein transport protein YIF1